MICHPIVEKDLARIHAAVGLRSEWNGAILVVTGCAGFVGFYLLHYLIHYGRELGITRVIGLDSFSLGKPRWLLELAGTFPELLSLHEFDVSTDFIGDITGAERARYVLHAASVASPPFYRRFPLETIDANVWGLRRLLDFYKEVQSLEGLLFFSSSEVYGDPDPAFIPTSEAYRGNVPFVGPRACYDESKRLGETLCYVFATTHRMPVTVVRPFNNYGPGMRLADGRLPADFARAILEKRDITIYSDGAATRTFCYVSDAVAGFLLCLLHGRYDCFNIGAAAPEIHVRELAELYRAAGDEMFGYSGRVVYGTSADREYVTDNPVRRCPDIRKAREVLGFKPQVNLTEGIRRYLEVSSHDGGGEPCA